MREIIFEILIKEKEDPSKDADTERSTTGIPKLSRHLDQAFDELISLITKDYILFWFEHLMSSSEFSKKIIYDDAWVIILNLRDRLARVDRVKLIANDVVKRITEHFEKIRIVQTLHESSSNGGHELPKFAVSPHLMTNEQEIEYLAKLSEALIIMTFPSDYSSNIPLRHFLREIFARHVLAPAIDTITDPFTINRKILAYVKKNQSIKDISQKTFNYANSYEDFLKMISSANDRNEIEQIRYNILTEIMQATTMENIRKAKGCTLSSSNDQSSALPLPQGPTPGSLSLVSSRAMKRYIRQLVHAKTLCEKRLAELGLDSYGGKDLEGFIDLEDPCHGKASFAAIMKSPFLRRFFFHYLEEENQHFLLGFCSAVDELKQADKTTWHQLGTEIFYCYINKASSNLLRPEREQLRRIENFLLGEGGPDVFYEMQRKVLVALKDTYFPPFLISGHYKRMLEEAEEKDIDLLNTDVVHDTNVEESDKSLEIEPAAQSPEEAKSQLEQITERLQNKLQAMNALKGSLKPDSKVLIKLKKEIKSLESQRKDVALHIARTDAWASNLGMWKCNIQSVDFSEPTQENKDSWLMAKMVVHVPDKEKDVDAEHNSWKCIRKISEFHKFHRDLVPYVSWVKGIDLPPTSRPLFSRNSSSSNKAFLDKSKLLLQHFMDKVMSDDQLSRSEVVYSFLSPFTSSGQKTLSRTPTSPSPSAVARSNFAPIYNFLRGDNSAAVSAIKEDDDIMDDQCWLDETDNLMTEYASVTDRGGLGVARGDTIAEALYGLIGEVFDMRGVFKWVRKSLMTFVQITYGSSINRQIRNSVSWITSEQMILQYLAAFKKAFWMNDKPRPLSKERVSADQLSHITAETRELLTPENIPEVLITLVGQQTALNGCLKVFETLQNKTLNKELFYSVLELCVLELFPELSSVCNDRF